MRLSILIFWALVAFTPFQGWAVTPGEIAKVGQQKYESADYLQAIASWQELKDIGFLNGNLDYNIGEAFWRLGKVGEARRYFLKALSLDPRNPAIRDNLLFIEDKLNPKPPDTGIKGLFFRVPWWKLSLNYSEALKVCALTAFILFGYLIWRRLKLRKAKWWITLPLALILLNGVSQLVYRGQWAWVPPRAVIVVPQAKLLKVPAPEALTGNTLSDGAIITVKKRQGDFRLVKSASGKEGWLEAQSIGEI